MPNVLFAINEAKIRIWRISRNSLYALSGWGLVPSRTIGCRRIVSASVFDELFQASSIARSYTTVWVRSLRSPQALPGESASMGRMGRVVRFGVSTIGLFRLDRAFSVLAWFGRSCVQRGLDYWMAG